MNLNVINKLLSVFPEGEKKESLRQKLHALTMKSKKRGGDGLQDTFELQPKGHIKIEAIDEHGNVVGVLADQSNLVVHGAEEILLRAFSGDPSRILYKNRVVKAANGITPKIYISESKLSGSPIVSNGKVIHSPNVLWEVVDDSLFDVSYGYIPNTVYIKEEASTEPGKRAFTISNAPDVNRVPMSAEIYSTYTNLFIGIGEGKNYSVPLTDSRLQFSEEFTVTENRAEATQEGASLEVTAKISNFKVELEKSNTGAQVDVYVNGLLRETIETFDSELSEPDVFVYELEGLDHETETTIRLVHSGSDSAVTTPVMAITGFYFDALDKKMNGLIKEFKNFETEFHTPTSFNTTPMAPYTIQLPYFPLKQGTIQVQYEGTQFTEVSDATQLTDTSFAVDYLHGTLIFNRALTGVMVTYAITGEIYDAELVSTMTAGTVAVPTQQEKTVTGGAVNGVKDGSNRVFTLGRTNIKSNTVVVYKNNNPLQVGPTGDIESIDYQTGTIVFHNGKQPISSDALKADYVYFETVTVNVAVNKYQTAHVIKEGTVRILDQNGNELQSVNNAADFGNGKFMVDATNKKLIHIAAKNAQGENITKVEVIYKSDEKPGVPTHYTRAVIEKPKTANEYPWFELDKGAVKFVAEFPELKPVHNITIREMGLFDGPRVEDNIEGFRNYPVKAFSLVRVGEARKESSTGIRVTWTITLLNSDGQPFQGGRN